MILPRMNLIELYTTIIIFFIVYPPAIFIEKMYQMSRKTNEIYLVLNVFSSIIQIHNITTEGLNNCFSIVEEFIIICFLSDTEHQVIDLLNSKIVTLLYELFICLHQ